MNFSPILGIASLIFVLSIILSMVALFAASMSDNPLDHSAWPAIRLLCGGCLLALVIAVSPYIHFHR